MADVAATLTELRIEDQTLAFTVSVTGDAGGHAEVTTIVYDAAGTERQRTDLGSMSVGDIWEAHLDLPRSTLDDGDYGAWVYVVTVAADERDGPSIEQGVSFLVGRGRIYPSREAADKRTFTTPPTLSALRLEGTWIVFDMTNHEAFDVEVSHQLSVSTAGLYDNYQTFHGQELVRAGATQQGHYLLPDHLADGRYDVLVTIQNEGSDLMDPAIALIQVDGNVITEVPMQ